jgi:integrase
LGSVITFLFFIFPNQTGTATSSPVNETSSPTFEDSALVNVLWWMKKQGYAESTIEATGKRLRNLKKNCDLNDPESVKGYVANKKCTNGFKETLIETYDFLMRSTGAKWDKPFYDRYDKLPKIPSEQRINMLISYASKRMALFLSMSRDLGSRPIELTWLKVKDINLENGTVNITSAKHCVGRVLKIKATTLDMLKQYINKKNLNLDDRIFPVKSSSVSESYRKLRRNLSEKLQDPVFRTIRLYDFRHFKASMEDHKSKDLLYVKSILGHKDLRTTLRYVQLLGDLGNDEYTCKAAKTLEEATALIEAGFEYVTEMDGIKLFKKRK